MNELLSMDWLIQFTTTRFYAQALKEEMLAFKKASIKAGTTTIPGYKAVLGKHMAFITEAFIPRK